MKATKVGSIPVSSLINGREKQGMISEILVVPYSRQNLMSVSQIDRRGGEVIFENGEVKVYLNNGVLKNGLY